MPDESLYYLIVPENAKDFFVAIPSGRPGMLTGRSAREILKKMEEDTRSRLGPFAPSGPSWVRYDPALHGALDGMLSLQR